jgi:NDP-sugar pyrophosphorylase family protein
MKMPPIAVIAGGLAQRMRPVTETIPKSMLLVAGEPFIAHQLRLLRREGIERAVLCIGHLGEVIEAYVGDGRAYGLHVEYSRDGERLRGTGGALRRARERLGEEFMVTYGDSYLDTAFTPIVTAFRASHQPALMTVYENRGQYDSSNIDFRDGRIVTYAKGEAGLNWIDYGLQMLRSDVFDHATDESFDLSVLYAGLVADGRMAGYEVATRFYEIGSPGGLAETEAYILSRTSKGDA